MKKKGTNSVVNQDSGELQRKIGLKLKRVRKELGYSNSDLFAYEKGLNRAQYGKYEAGSQDMRLSSLAKIINAMGLTFEEFFENSL